MKKWFLGILAIIIIGSILGIYRLIPANIVILRVSPAQVTLNGANRVLPDVSKWKKWWRNEAGQPPDNDGYFIYNGYQFRVTDHEMNVVGVEISKGNFRLNSIMHLVNLSHDSTVIIWQSDTVSSGSDPITRLWRYSKAATISESMKGILHNLKPFISNPQNVYDFSIYKTSTRDTTMLSARFTSPAYPTTTQIYGYFDALKKSIQKQKGIPVGFPMMNIRKLEKDSFETQVAIPTNRELKDDGNIVYRRLVPGNFIAANVQGGVYTTNEAMKQVRFFIADNSKQIIANPFQILVTDRIKEPDTLKWITKVYVPVVE
jgi:effector-binding domain-containing protein